MKILPDVTNELTYREVYLSDDGIESGIDFSGLSCTVDRYHHSDNTKGSGDSH
jgi:hypothetical protein